MLFDNDSQLAAGALFWATNPGDCEGIRSGRRTAQQHRPNLNGRTSTLEHGGKGEDVVTIGDIEVVTQLAENVVRLFADPRGRITLHRKKSLPFTACENGTRDSCRFMMNATRVEGRKAEESIILVGVPRVTEVNKLGPLLNSGVAYRLHAQDRSLRLHRCRCGHPRNMAFASIMIQVFVVVNKIKGA